MIKAVFIDIDDTLLDFSKCAEYSMSESFKDFGLVFSDYMFPVFEEINAGLWKRLEKGEITKSDLYGKRWVTILGKFGITSID
nr:HAD family hydrolase [Oscillospiraceae bacterium]